MKPAKAAKASLSEELKKKITELDSRIFHLERRKSEEKTTFMHCCYIIDNEIYVNVDYTNLMLENTHTHTHSHTHTHTHTQIRICFSWKHYQIERIPSCYCHNAIIILVEAQAYF